MGLVKHRIVSKDALYSGLRWMLCPCLPIPVSASYKGSARPSLIPSLCTHFTRAGIEWRR